MKLDFLFQLIAVILAGVAAYFFWFTQYDAMFVAIVLGCVSFFLSIRMQVKERLRQREADERTADDA